jgi:plasmid stabilization system protein ParE
MHEIRYLPLARKDLADITNYIADHLKAPKAAIDLLDSLDEAISRLGQFPYSYRVYQPIKALIDEYRLLPVKNYAVFYVVKAQVVEIHRIVYSRMDLSKIGM